MTLTMLSIFEKALRTHARTDGRTLSFLELLVAAKKGPFFIFPTFTVVEMHTLPSMLALPLTKRGENKFPN